MKLIYVWLMILFVLSEVNCLELTDNSSNNLKTKYKDPRVVNMNLARYSILTNINHVQFFI